MARTVTQRSREFSLAVRRVPTDDSITRLAGRKTRFAVSARRVLVRAVAAGALLAAGWLLAVLFGMLSAAPAAADTTAATGAGTPRSATGSFADALSPVGGGLSASDNAEAMAGLTVDGLTSQSDPGLPPSTTSGDIMDTDGLVPNGGGNGPFGPSTGDVTRSVHDPRPELQLAVPAYVLPPVVRTAADDPSFSPD